MRRPKMAREIVKLARFRPGWLGRRTGFRPWQQRKKMREKTWLIPFTPLAEVDCFPSVCVCAVQYIWLYSTNPIITKQKKRVQQFVANWILRVFYFGFRPAQQQQRAASRKRDREGFFLLAQSKSQLEYTQIQTHACWSKTIIIQLNGCQRMHLISVANKLAIKRVHEVGEGWRERPTNSIFHGHTNTNGRGTGVCVCEVLMRCCDALLLLAVCCFCHLCKKTQKKSNKKYRFSSWTKDFA